VLAIFDTGHGMSEETQSHIELFFTTKDRGRNGLGLATVYGPSTRAGLYRRFQQSRNRHENQNILLRVEDPVSYGNARDSVQVRKGEGRFSSSKTTLFVA
jgi:hypothetical protein